MRKPAEHEVLLFGPGLETWIVEALAVADDGDVVDKDEAALECHSRQVDAEGREAAFDPLVRAASDDLLHLLHVHDV